jgi:hypothetical protein
MPVNLKQTSLGILCLPFREKDGRVSPGAPTHLISSSHREQLAAKPAPTLYIAIPGIEELDLCAPADSILTFEDGVQILSPGVFGPPSPNTYFLVLGRATTTLKGLTVHPSLVDNDYTGEIKILVSAPRGPVALPLPLDTSHPGIGTKLGSSQPGSSDLYWVQAITGDHPILCLKINGKSFEGLLDSGTDSTLISQSARPTAWLLQASLTHFQGIGQSKNTLQSSKLLTWEDNEGNSGSIQPFVVPGLPVNLWGRDILSQMKVFLCNPNAVIAQQMLSQGYLPGQGLSKNSQGKPTPLEAPPRWIVWAWAIIPIFHKDHCSPCTPGRQDYVER